MKCSVVKSSVVFSWDCDQNIVEHYTKPSDPASEVQCKCLAQCPKKSTGKKSASGFDCVMLVRPKLKRSIDLVMYRGYN